MNLKKTHSKSFKITALVLTVLMVVLVTVYILEKRNITHVLPGITPDNTQTAEQKQQTELDTEKKKNLIESPANTDTPPQDNSIEITTQANSTEVVLFTKLIGYGEGTCDLSISNGGNSYNMSADIIYQNEYSTCAGFSIPISELGSGVWNISISASSGAKVSTKQINLEVN
jgi:hypothetical protein